MKLLELLLVSFGGACGATARYGIGLCIGKRVRSATTNGDTDARRSTFANRNITAKWGSSFVSLPWGTFVVNGLGSAGLALLVRITLIPGSDVTMIYAIMHLLGIGFCGAFTTFSTFGYETFTLLHSKQYGAAIMYLVLSVALCLFISFMILH